VSDPFAYSILTTCCGILGVLFSFFYVRKIDRRDIMIYGMGACGLFQLMPAVAWTVAPNSQFASRAVVASVALFKFAYTTMGEWMGPLVVRRKANGSRSVCMVNRRRIPQQSATWICVRHRIRAQLFADLAGYLHGAVLHQSSRAKLERQVRVHLVRFQHDHGDIHLLPAS